MADIYTDAFLKSLFNQNAAPFASIDFDTDPIYILLVDTTGAAVADATKKGWVWRSDVTNEVAAGGGYTTGGIQVASAAVNLATHTITFTCANPAWATATISAHGAWFFKRVGADLTTPGDDPLIAFFDFGAVISSTADTFTVGINAAGVLSAA